MDEPKKETVSRRQFIGTAGKLIGLGVLTHFTMIGKAYAANPPGLGGGEDCKENKLYICSTNHACNSDHPFTNCGAGLHGGSMFECTKTGKHDCQKGGYTAPPPA